MKTYQDIIDAIDAGKVIVFDLNNTDFSMFDDCFHINQIRFDQSGVFVRQALPMLANDQVARYDQEPSGAWYFVRRGPAQFETEENLKSQRENR